MKLILDIYNLGAVMHVKYYQDMISHRGVIAFWLPKFQLSIHSHNLVSKGYIFMNLYHIYEQWHEISNNVVCATRKASDQPAHTRSLIRAFASRWNILWVLSYWLDIILSV